MMMICGEEYTDCFTYPASCHEEVCAIHRGASLVSYGDDNDVDDDDVVYHDSDIFLCVFLFVARLEQEAQKSNADCFMNFSFKNLPQLASFNMDILTSVTEVKFTKAKCHKTKAGSIQTKAEEGETKVGSSGTKSDRGYC